MRFTRGGLSSPSLVSIACINNDMSQTAAVLILDTSSSSVCFVFGECCKYDCEESGNALVVFNITIRPYRLVVRPEVCTSG